MVLDANDTDVALVCGRCRRSGTRDTYKDRDVVRCPTCQDILYQSTNRE